MLLMRKYDEENSACLLSHPVRGAWIEIKEFEKAAKIVESRTPSGVRGLKLLSIVFLCSMVKSHPVRGAWIEIHNMLALFSLLRKSHPVRGAWIEISFTLRKCIAFMVAPRQGCVD